MNPFSVIGMLFIIGVLVSGIVTTLSPHDYHLFGDLPAIFLVLGGTLATAALTVQINRVGVLIKVFFQRLIKSNRTNYKEVIKEIMIISEAYRTGESLGNQIPNVKDHFLKESLQLIEDNILKGDELIDVLEERIENTFSIHSEEANRFKNLGKYPPAFGLMGTVLGMISLLSGLGGADAMKKIGPAMGGLLVATFYGIVVANVFVLPIGDSLSDGAKEQNLKNKIIAEGVKLILQKTNPIIVAEKLNSFLLPSDRLDWKSVIGQKS